MSDERLTCRQVLDLLPQQRPFRFVDEILEVDDGSISGRYTFRPDECFYAGHFPGRPITPGVILLECMCQIGVVALGIYLYALDSSTEHASGMTALLAEADAEFLRPVLPGDTVTIQARRLIWRMNKLRCRIEMFGPDGAVVARATASGVGVRNV